MKSGPSSHRQRSAMMHQHRSSAAAISDPMLASGLTEQLVSASGPLTGSGSALNQLGGSGYNAGAFSNYYQQRAPGGEPLVSAGADYPYQANPSRYDTHLMSDHVARGATRARSHTLGAGYSHHQGASTTAGAYHLDPASRANLDPMLATGSYEPASHRLGYQASAQDSRGYLQDRASGQLGPAYGQSALLNQVGAFDGSANVGLGAYNPLDESLATSGAHQPLGSMRQQQMSSVLHPQQHPQQPMDPMAGLNYGPPITAANRESYLTELRARLMELQNSYANVKRELDVATQKLGSSMHSIKTFWSPELKKERALRKEEATKYALINDQMKLMRVEVQVSVFGSAFFGNTLSDGSNGHPFEACK